MGWTAGEFVRFPTLGEFLCPPQRLDRLSGCPIDPSIGAQHSFTLKGPRRGVDHVIVPSVEATHCVVVQLNSLIDLRNVVLEGAVRLEVTYLWFIHQ